MAGILLKAHLGEVPMLESSLVVFVARVGKKLIEVLVNPLIQ